MCGPGSSMTPKWVIPRDPGRQASTVSSERSQVSMSMSGGGVGGITRLAGGILVAATSPTKARPLPRCR